MQRLLFASAVLVVSLFASQANAIQDLPGYDLYRGAGAASSFYSEGFAGYPGSYGAGLYVAGYGFAGNGYGGFGGPGCCGARVMQGVCNPWAGYTGHDPCGRFHGHHFGHFGRRSCGAACGADNGSSTGGELTVDEGAIDAAPVVPNPPAAATATPQS
jgi:hypothetical protein